MNKKLTIFQILKLIFYIKSIDLDLLFDFSHIYNLELTYFHHNCKQFIVY